MNKFKEYDIRMNELSEWLPYMALITPTVFLNKDDSVMSVLSYGKCTDNIEKANEFLNKLPSGIAFWICGFFEKEKTFCFIVWNPDYDDAGLIKNYPSKNIKNPIENFSYFVENLTNNLKSFLPDVQIIAKNDALNILSEILSLQKCVPMPDMALYLDCYLTQDHAYTKEEPYLKIDDSYLNSIRILGYPNIYLKDILQILRESSIKYRYARRMIFLDEKMKNKTQEKYFKNWCASYRTFLNFLKIKDDEKALYIDNILILHDKNSERLKECISFANEYINSAGYVTVSDDYNPGDIWFSSIPAMFRTGYNHSIIGLKNTAENLVL